MNNLNSILDYLKVFNNINKRPAYEPRITAQEPRIELAGGQLVQNTVDGSRPGYDGDSSFNRNPSGINQHTDAQRTFEEIQKAIDDAPPKFVKRKDGTLKKVPVTPKDLYGKGKNYPHKIIARTEYDLHKDKLNIEGTGKPVVEDPKKGNIVRYAKNKLQSNPTILAKMAGKEDFHLSHLSLTELDSLKNLGYLPKNINIKQYHSFEKKIVANAKEIYAAQNNKSLSIPERRAEIAKLQKIDRALRKEFPKYAETKARLKVQANNLESSGLKITEKLPNPEVAISQTEGTLLKDIKAGSQKEKEILGLSEKSFKEVVNNSKKGGALLTNNILNKSEKFKKVKICKTDFASGGGGLCGKAFAEADPQAYLEKVMKDQRLAGYLKSKEALTVGRSFLTKVAKVGSWANPLTLVGGEAWYSVLAGYNEWGKGASLGEAVNEGLWFIPGKHSRDLDMLLGTETKGKEGRNLPVIADEVRGQFDLLTQLGGLINEEGKLSGQLQMQKLYEADMQNESDRLLHASRFDFPTYKKNIAAQGRTDFFQDMASDINWSKTQITPQIEERLKNVMTEGEDVVQKYQAADPTGQAYPALQEKIKDFIVNKYNKGRTFDLADPYSGPVWNWMKRSFEQINHWSDDALTKRQEELDYLKLTGQLEDQSITKESIPPELIENFLTKFPEYSYVFEGATGGRAGYTGGGLTRTVAPDSEGIMSLKKKR